MKAGPEAARKYSHVVLWGCLTRVAANPSFFCVCGNRGRSERVFARVCVCVRACYVYPLFLFHIT